MSNSSREELEEEENYPVVLSGRRIIDSKPSCPSLQKSTIN
jgi:hypothetical protein